MMRTAGSVLPAGVCSTSYQAAPTCIRPGPGPRNLPAARHILGRPVYATNGSGSTGTSSAGSPDMDAQLRELKKKAAELAADASDAANRAFKKLDNEYNITEQAAKAGKKVEEAARDVDQQYSVRRRLRNAVEEVQRKWPVWQTQLNEFGATWYGKAAIILGICLLFSSSFFWKFMNFVLLLWWLSIPLSFLLVDQVRKAQADRMAAAQQQEEARRQRNPFADIFRARARPGSAGRGGSVSKRYTQQDGPVIDAEWSPLDKK